MLINRRTGIALGMAALFSLGTVTGAADATLTVITVEKMHCKGCAKKLAAKLEALEGVLKVEADVEAKTLTVTPKPDAVVSPRALWDAVVKGKDIPTKLTGPGGTFTKKPAT